jgi:hypothetical protein
VKHLRQSWPWATIFVSLLIVSSVAVHPFGTPKQFDGDKTSVDELKFPTEVAAIFTRSCVDCHSSQTAWPWYSYVAPLSWLVERDVSRGRDHMNLSEWQQYTFKEKEKLLADIASAVRNGAMPLPQYTLVHRDARLSDADRDTVYDWARRERRKLRAASLASQRSADNGARTAPSSVIKSSIEAVH